MKIEDEVLTTEAFENDSCFPAAQNILDVPDHDALADLLLDLLPSERNVGERTRVEAWKLYTFCSMSFKNCLAVKLLGVYSAKPPYREAVRESAIRRLDDLLSNHKDDGTASFLLPVIEDRIAPKLISCLKDDATFEGTFEILANVVSHVAFEILFCHDTDWDELEEYIFDRVRSNSRSNFKKAICVFRKLPLCLDGEEFVIPLADILYTKIMYWLDPPESESHWEMEINWHVTFTGAFCLVLHLVESERDDLARVLAHQMLQSANDLVKNGKEIGFVRKALFEVEILVSNQSLQIYYSAAEYRVVLALLRRISGIEGLQNKSRILIWRIWAILQKNTSKSEKQKANSMVDWLDERHGGL